MKQVELIRDKIMNYKEKELIFASNLYKKFYFQETEVSEMNFYKVLERLVEKNELVRVCKGIYSRPHKSKFGLLMPTEKEIADAFIEDEKGMITGYHLYNKLGLTTQISKNYRILSNSSYQKSTIKNIKISQVDLLFTKKVKENLAMIEVLSEIHKIQDLNERAFIAYCEEFASNHYDEQTLEMILGGKRYSKSTINFLKIILDAYQTPNNMQKHLSSLSKYKELKVKYCETA